MRKSSRLHIILNIATKINKPNLTNYLRNHKIETMFFSLNKSEMVMLYFAIFLQKTSEKLLHYERDSSSKLIINFDEMN